MENSKNAQQDCGCSDGCCTPKKKNNLWSKIIFLLIVIAAGTIITIKLVGKQDAPPEKCCENPENTSCCPQSKTEE